ncbi:MAG: D-glycero-beta-D-manno-heptose 1-phosphate adenylyltransferase [Sphingobacteriales bacterium 17-39-43]|jgi:rfaE bifunctional protein nucleotidyltransferase chain/domain|uniref:D-glycero-beta-D-manno-heptose 1-phosphate adenylyltransferase n=1 Tax=Daejeonella sp. TaxID=2805397 RepID=UPI000BC7FEAE|nr:D-glycero-beta-D-manno-heptose 1-phosphate adenylyltransferase [Daejeonella sp.]OYZ30822.1 MAG: D-glycero-beta-D-manno-heptose 1-phosphate adenylyltransferase [Sphingobacteriales bacterium 16-39-50]OYZ59338.1 MAG: D-glycero-beta-D-manno-heptose 1-phosphate adenylyltransferase [Sphingobacteriales bacterium 24-40-4]OZA23558.1 MAG: D-glycero-beta-D-manno-heptose 1-phosphate adenylyltransferase [Sphingobacteriales bacterium 17-39-43]OZA59395.1 MAG: D-glycero-beta-D-manno-heptose 1-phosphate aden
MSRLENIKSKIYTTGQIKAVLNVWRLLGKRVVFTNGCFDLLHLGHIDYLSKAADMGDKLVIGLNSDASASALKGPGRPITDQLSRSLMLASFSFVDAVVIFDEPTPLHLIELVRPDILVKGADYSIEQIVGADLVLQYGGEVKTIEYLSGYSTTLIEKKIRSNS